MAFEINDLPSLIEHLECNNNLENFTYISKIPQICKTVKCVLGIDEAGRGPVLGPMVYGITFCPLIQSDILETLKCEDSKVLTEKKRDEIFSKICESSNTVGWAVEVISPKIISNFNFKRSKVSLNDVSMTSAIQLIRKVIAEGVQVASIYVDTVGPPEKYQEKLKALFPDYLITVAKKADSKYPIVSAASICAKVTRDYALKVWKLEDDSKIDVKLGSGYPGDAVTKQFLKNNLDPVFGFPNIVRFCWSTAESILEEEAFHVEWDDKEENSSNSNTLDLTAFFKVPSKSQNGVTLNKHKFFSERFLTTTTNL